MKQATIFFLFILFHNICSSQLCRFEKTNGQESATYFEAIDWYKKLDATSKIVKVFTKGNTDAGYPLHVVILSAHGKFNPIEWHQQNKVTILINNGIHPGEPDGIDASMMLARDIANKKIILPNNIIIAIIPVYNIGGCLNRSSTSRVNQNGPVEYGFRGNAQNLDLNRDFIKCDSREAKSFTQIFHWLQPDILVDNHVSDGADYQHTFTLLTTQYNKLGNNLGKWLKENFEPQLYSAMADKKWDVCPYVNFESSEMDKGMEMFYDPPRYSSGYAALFQTIAFVPETHMLKPFKERVNATYDFMDVLLHKASINSTALLQQRKIAKENILKQTQFPLSWQVDSTKFSFINFKGYNAEKKPSNVTGVDRLFYNHTKPFTRQVKFFNTFVATNVVNKPIAYIIPQGWHKVIELLKNNGVVIKQLSSDTLINVEVYFIDKYSSYNNPYESHHKNYNVKVNTEKKQIHYLKGDYIIYLNQDANRYLVETLEPTGDDSFFAWNYFDAILQQKEGYSDYRWEDVAAEVLEKNTELKTVFNNKKLTDSAFAINAAAQLDYIYKHSQYYEPVHLRYPVFRLLQ